MNAVPILQFDSVPPADAERRNIDAREEAAQTCVVAVERLVTSRLLIQANSGGGKSHALRTLLEQTHGRLQQFVFDPEGEFSSLREKYPYLLVGKEGAEVAADPHTAKLLCRRLLESGVSAILDLYDLPLPDRRRFVRLFLEELMRAPRELWRPLLVVLDEAHLFCPERGAGEAESTQAVISLCTQGRKRGFAAVLATQRIAKLHKDAAAELLNKLIGRTGLDVDVRRAGDELGFDKEQRGKLKFLRPGQFYAFGPAIGDGGAGVLLVQTAQVATSHAAPGVVAPPPPPTPEAIRALAAQFADLAPRADADAEDLHSAHARIRELEGLVARVRAEAATTPAPTPRDKTPNAVVATRPSNVGTVAPPTPQRTVTRIIEVPVEIEVPVKVPVLRPSEAERLETLAADLSTAAQGLTKVAGELHDLLAAARQSLADADAPRRSRVIKAEATVLETPTKDPTAARREIAGTARTTKRLVAATTSPYKTVRALPPAPKSRAEHSGADVSAPQQRILDALASFAAFGMERAARNNVAVWAEQSPLSSGFSNNLGRLRSLGLITYPANGFVALTPEGAKRAAPSVPLRSPEDLLAAWLARLPRPQGRILKELAAHYPDALDRETLAHLTGQSPLSSGFSNNLGRLRTLGLVVYPGRGDTKLGNPNLIGF